MTLDELVTYVRSQYREYNEAEHSDADLKTYIFFAAQKFIHKTRCCLYRESFDTTAVVTPGEYTLTYPILRENEALFVNTDGDARILDRVHSEYWDYQSEKDNGQREYAFYVDRRTSTLKFDPDWAGTFYIQYWFRFTTTDNQEFTTLDTLLTGGFIPEEYHEALTDYAISLMYKKDRMLNESSYHFNAFQATMKDAVIEMEDREPRSVFSDFSLNINNPHRNENELFKGWQQL
jgi:hypothetical protein